MFEGLEQSVFRYVELQQELKRVESFLKESLRAKLKNTKEEELLTTIISLLNNQKTDIMVKHEDSMNLLDVKEQLHGRQ